MNNISGLIEQLKHHMFALNYSGQGRKQIVLSFPVAEHNGVLLKWLDTQDVFPAFYWNDRDNREEVIALGAVKTFVNIDAANAFISDAPQSLMRVWGANAFNQLTTEPSARKGFLFLPRLEIAKVAENLSLTLNLYHEESLKTDIQTAIAFLEQIKYVTQEPMAQSIVVESEVHYPEKEQWCQLLEQALKSINDGEFDKVVMARKTLLTLSSPLNPVQFIYNSKNVNHHCYHFMLRFDKNETFLGASPERLFYRRSDELETEALAGTVANVNDDQEAEKLANWLINDDKNQRENELVVEDICQRLAAHVNKIEIQPIEVIRLRKVQHLKHGIWAKLNYINDRDCLFWLQPTAAVAGLPRKTALKFITNKEPFNREWYAGSVGYLSYNQTEFSVALRSALIKHNTISLYAGAGIVAGSNPFHEWIEIENKVAGLKTLLQEE